jgi:hypothetical protein
MGRTRKIRYAVYGKQISFTAKTVQTEFFGEWRVKDHGKLNVSNLEAYRKSFNQSMQEGGCNDHLRHTWSPVGRLWVVDQFNGNRVVCEYNPPMFEVI